MDVVLSVTYLNGIDSNTICDSVIYEDASNNIGIGTITPAGKLDVAGDAYINSVRVGRGAGCVSLLILSWVVPR